MDIPTTTPQTIEHPARGSATWAVQTALNDYHLSQIATDGIFGGITFGAVREFQERNDLFVDGRFGPKSQEKMARVLEKKVEIELPAGLLRGFTTAESSNYIAAVNWNSPGGVDCGYVQRRVYDGADNATKQRAFDSLYQLMLLGNNLAAWFYKYEDAGTVERSWRLAALQHNYPYAAEQYARGNWPSAYSTTEQKWVVAIGAKFKDGVSVRTPDQWCRFYALGAPDHNHPGAVTQFVKIWP